MLMASGLWVDFRAGKRRHEGESQQYCIYKSLPDCVTEPCQCQSANFAPRPRRLAVSYCDDR
jgi:hypothetical protein